MIKYYSLVFMLFCHSSRDKSMSFGILNNDNHEIKRHSVTKYFHQLSCISVYELTKIMGLMRYFFTHNVML